MGWLADIRLDLKHAVRLLRRGPLFTVTAALSLAIGLGANTAIFAVANSLLFRPPAGIASSDALVEIGTFRGDGGLNPLSYAAFDEIRRRSASLSGVFAQQMFTRVVSVAARDQATGEPAVAHGVTAEFFSVLGARPAAGRLFEGQDGVTGDVAVLDYDFWSRRFNRDPKVVGSVLRVNRRVVTVVGVTERGFQGTGVQVQDLWVVMGPADRRGSVLAGGRLRAGVPTAAAEAELAGIGAALDRGSRSSRGTPRLALLPLTRAGGNRNVVAGFAAALMSLVSIILAVACANVAGIALARAFARTHEMALRTALGARRGRLVRQLLTETAVLFLLSGAIGLALARAIISSIPLLHAVPTSVAVPVTLDLRVFAFAFGLSLLAAIVTGIIPAFKVSKAASSTGRGRLRGAFVVGQIALSVLLVAMAGLFVRALRHAGATDAGFDPRGVEIATLDFSTIEGDESARMVVWRDVIQRVRGLPTVQAASLARVPPGGWEGIGMGGLSPVDAAGAPQPIAPAWNIVDPGYFEALRIPLQSGRDFLATDTAGSRPVVIVGDGIARRLWPGQRVVGKSVVIPAVTRTPGQPATRIAEVVGVVADIKSSSLVDGLAGSYVYLPREQGDPDFTATMVIIARGRVGGRLGGDIAGVVHDLNPNLIVSQSETLGEAVAFGLAPQRVLAMVGGALGLVGVLLASIGIYGVVAFTVAQRRREFGIRMALGAERRAILWIVLKEGVRLVLPGVVVGLVLAALAGHVLSVFLYDLPALHVPTFAGTAILFLTVGTIACYLPARQALGLQPIEVLRKE